MKRILFASPPMAGHTNQLMVLAEELAGKNYSVSFATGTAFEDQLNNRGVQFLEWDPKSALQDKKLLPRTYGVWDQASKEKNILAGEKLIYTLLAEVYPDMFSSLKKIVFNLNPDLIIADSKAIPAIDLSFMTNTPCIVLAQFLGDYAPIPAGFPRFGTPYSIKMTAFERILNCLHPLRMLFYLRKPFSQIESYRNKLSVGIDLFSMYKNVLMLVSTGFGVEIPRPLPPNIQMIGPIISHTLPQISYELRRWLENSNKDVVYMSFGTLAKIKKWHAEKLVEGLKNDKFNVLWSLQEIQHSLLPEIPFNFRLESHVPQQAVLAHPSVKAFVSHCGMNSVSESLIFGKPILGLPIFGDQHYNAARIVDLGAGLKLSKESFTAEEIRQKINSILHTESFYKSTAWLSNVQRSYNGLQKAIGIIEGVLEAGYKHLLYP